MMVEKRISLFNIWNSALLVAVAFICIFPFIHLLALSFSKSSIAAAGEVWLWPKGFNITSYKFVLSRDAFWRAFMVTIKRSVAGVVINMLLTILAAYPLSKKTRKFRRRTFYVWIIFFTLLFSGGLIPTYMLVRELKMLDSLWPLLLLPPMGVPVFNVVILLNFFRLIPDSIEEAAVMNGANHVTILWRLYLPMSKAAIATLVLFVVVYHWNSWFDGMIYMTRPQNYPLQTYLRSIVIQKGQELKFLSKDQIAQMQNISDRTVKAAQIFIAAAPIIFVYPFLQKYFVTGLNIGGVKE